MGRKKYFLALVYKRTRPTELPPLVDEVNANLKHMYNVAWSAQRIPTAVMLIVTEQVKKFPASFYENRIFINVFTRVRRWFLFLFSSPVKRLYCLESVGVMLYTVIFQSVSSLVPLFSVFH
jgi:AAA+ ATPase superfamily predicted ATPase